jgi:hypothetical protein
MPDPIQESHHHHDMSWREEATCARECPICAEDALIDGHIFPCNACSIKVCRECAQRHLLCGNFETCASCKASCPRSDILRYCDDTFIRESFAKKRERVLLADELAIMRRERAATYTRDIRAPPLFKCAADGCDGFLVAPRLPCLLCYGSTTTTVVGIYHRAWSITCSKSECADVAWRRVTFAPLVCDTCGNESCVRCRRIVPTTTGRRPRIAHKCRADDVAAARVVDTTTRPCPGCLARVEKRDGCDQMHCTLCRTTFDWISGRAMPRTAHVHNPEYADRLRALGLLVRQRADVLNVIPRLNGDGADDCEIPVIICGEYIIATIVTLNIIARQRLSVYELNDYGNNVALRQRYARGELDEGVFARALAQLERRAHRDVGVYDAFATFVLVVSREIRALIAMTVATIREVADKTDVRVEMWSRQQLNADRGRIGFAAGVLAAPKDPSDAVDRCDRIAMAYLRFRFETVPELMERTNRALRIARETYTLESAANENDSVTAHAALAAAIGSTRQLPIFSADDEYVLANDAFGRPVTRPRNVPNFSSIEATLKRNNAAEMMCLRAESANAIKYRRWRKEKLADAAAYRLGRYGNAYDDDINDESEEEAIAQVDSCVRGRFFTWSSSSSYLAHATPYRSDMHDIIWYVKNHADNNAESPA